MSANFATAVQLSSSLGSSRRRLSVGSDWGRSGRRRSSVGSDFFMRSPSPQDDEEEDIMAAECEETDVNYFDAVVGAIEDIVMGKCDERFVWNGTSCHVELQIINTSFFR